MRRFLAAALLFLVGSAAPAEPSAPDAGAEPALNCVILPDEQVDVSSPVPGVLAEVFVGRSNRVEAGQVLARLESSVEEATVALARERERTDAEIRLRRVELGYDAQHRERLQALHTRNATSAQSREDAERVAEAARIRVRLAEDRRRQALLERRRADAVLSLKTVRSPIHGVVVQRHKTVGEYVEDHPIVRIARLDPLRVEVIAPLALFGTVHPGMQVGIRPETDPESERVATVSAVDAVADPGSGTFGVELRLPNPGLELPAGIKCKGRVLPRVADGATAPGNGVVAREPALAEPQVGGRDAGATEEAEPRTGPAAPLPVAARRIAPSAACLTYQALDDEPRARALSRAAEAMGARAEVQEVREDRPFSYLVATPAPTQPGSLRDLGARLRQAGISDFALLRRGDHAGRISLGVYNGPRSAERRRAEVNALGFDTEVLPRTRSHRAWRVELRLPAVLERGAVRTALERHAGGSDVESDECPPLQTASR